jgi:hypothetical protein|tara:strand:- start:113 stop:805 length:693 start_codon:yes stop_codon:yes gene_type:complete
MGKVYQNKICETCGNKGKVIETWGHKYCKECYDKRPKKGGGHSGMVKVKGLKPQQPLALFEGLELERTTKGNKLFATLYLEHYPQSKGILGRQLNYFIKKDGKVVGVIGVNSPPLNYKKFRAYFNTDNEKLFVNNNVFRIVETEKNLGTKVLKLLRNRIKIDYKEKYKDELIGIVTFVEPPRTGAVYKADNWDYLGETLGKKCFRRGDMGKWINKEWGTGTKKLIFAINI